MPDPSDHATNRAGRKPAAAAARPTPARGKSHFLGIGIDAYENFSRLRNAVRDVRAVAELLLADYDVAPDACTLLLNADASRRGIQRALRELGERVGPDDKVLIYYSGHGHLNRYRRGFWVPVEAEPGAEEDFVSNARLRELIADIPSRHTLLISDACFSGALFVRGADRADLAADDLELRPSRWAICSGRHDQLVADGPPGGHSPFAQSLLAELRHNQRAALRVATLADRVVELTKANYEDQLPEGSPLQGVGHQGGQYVFRRRADEEAFWESCRTSNTLDDYLDYLDRYPEGKYVEEAHRLVFQQEDDDAWNEAGRLRTISAYLSYQRRFPQGRYREEARLAIAGLRGREREKPAPAPAKPALPAPIQQLLDDMVRVAGGSFIMGYKDEARDGDNIDHAKPAHEVTLRDFYLAKCPVTQAQWRAVMGEDPPQLHNKGCDQCPVERVSWKDVQNFIQKLNELTGLRFRLPSEAEWEYAARGGQLSKDYRYSGSNDVDEVAWYKANAQRGNTHGEQKTTRPVGGKKPNELGLYDLSGHVWEWCEDGWHENYKGAPSDGSAWLSGGDQSRRVLRGGSWFFDSWYCRSAYRYWFIADFRFFDIGFRLARD